MYRVKYTAQEAILKIKKELVPAWFWASVSGKRIVSYLETLAYPTTSGGRVMDGRACPWSAGVPA
jgi:hypothetical protein